jgi:hypothetical protein
MRLAGADRAGEQHILRPVDPAAAGELEHDGRVEAVGEGEVEGVERLELGEAGGGQAGAPAPPSPSCAVSGVLGFSQGQWARACW